MGRRYFIQDYTLSELANTIREQGQLGDIPMNVTQMPSYIRNGTVNKGLLDGTISYIINNTISSIRSYCFGGCANLSLVSLAQCSYVGQSAFVNCTALTDLYLPNCTSYGQSAFHNCEQVTRLTLGVPYISIATATEDLYTICQSNPNLEELTLTQCSLVNSSVFGKCSNLKSIIAPELLDANKHAFQDCSSLTHLSLPKIRYIGAYTFERCKNIVSVDLPELLSLGASPFSGCSSLETFYAPKLMNYSTSSLPFGPIGVSTSGGVITFKNVTVGFSTVPNLFSNQKNLIYFSASQAQTLNTNALRGCTALESTGLHLGDQLSLIGATAFYGCTGLTKLTPEVFPRGLKLVGNDPVPIYDEVGLTIGVQAFGACTNLSYVSLKGISGILSNSAFQNCTALTEVYLEGKNSGNTLTIANLSTTPFVGCTSLTKLTLNGVSSITTEACCRSLPITTLTINESTPDKPANITAKLGFANCVNLSTINGNIASVGNQTFASCGILDLSLSTLVTIGTYGFNACKSLTRVSLPECTNAGILGFNQCTSLSQVFLPKVTTLGASAASVTFSGCTELHTIHLDTIATIPSDAFMSLYALSSLYIPNCTLISQNALKGCSALTKLSGPKVTNFGHYNLQSGNMTKELYLPVCSYFGKYALSNTVLESIYAPAWSTAHASGVFHASHSTTLKYVNLGYAAIPAWFSACVNLSTFIAEKCTALAAKQFMGDTALIEVSLPICATIAAQAFQGCTALPFIALPKATKISASAFSGCTNFSIITLENSSVCVLDNVNAFTGTGITSTTGSIYVPGALLNSYKTATNWSNFKSRIFPYDAVGFSIRGTPQQVFGTGNKTWTDWQNTSNYTNNAKYYYTASSYNSSWPNYITIYYSTSNYTGAYNNTKTSIYRYPKQSMAGYRAGYSAIDMSTTLYQTSIPGTFSFVGYVGRSYSYGQIIRNNPDGTVSRYYGVSVISTGTSYISYFKFADSTAVITPGYNYQTGTITSTI